MDKQFKITENDIRLLPYSPVNEDDTVEIRCQVFNSGEDGETEVEFLFDGEKIHAEKLYIKSNSYGFVKCPLPIENKAGNHEISINGVSLPLEVKKEKKVLLDGGFLMIGPPNDRHVCDSFRDDVKKFTDDMWAQYVDALNDINQTCLVIQATHQYLNLEYENRIYHGSIVAHYDSACNPKSDICAHDPVKAILETAEKNGQHVFVGVGNQYGYGGTKEEMKELLDRYGKYTSFYGWYLSCEFNMSNFNPEKLDNFQDLVEYAREIAPVKPILISPFGLPSEECINYLLDHDIFDIMMAQDCVGQKRVTVSESDKMHKTLLEACEKINKHLWANCESFNFTEEIGKTTFVYSDENNLVPRFRDGGFDGEEGFVQQMQAVRPYVEKILTFAFTGLFSPDNLPIVPGGAPAVEQYKKYVKYMNKI